MLSYYLMLRDVVIGLMGVVIWLRAMVIVLRAIAIEVMDNEYMDKSYVYMVKGYDSGSIRDSIIWPNVERCIPST